MARLTSRDRTRDIGSGAGYYRKIAWWLAVSGIAALLVSVFAYSSGIRGALSSDSGDWGTFGDFVGGFAGTLIGLGTLIALAIALQLQARELSETRAALEEQSRAISRQVFEATFFQLLTQFREVREGVTHKGTAGSSGREALARVYGDMKAQYPIPSATVGQPPPQLDAIRSMHRSVYRPTSHEDVLGPYFRTLYHVFKFIDRAALSDDEKVTYANIARAQLTIDEVALLFYNGLSEHGVDFKPLIEKYGVLKHLNPTILPNMRHRDDPALYAPTAFMSAEDRALYQRGSGTSV